MKYKKMKYKKIFYICSFLITSIAQAGPDKIATIYPNKEVDQYLVREDHRQIEENNRLDNLLRFKAGFITLLVAPFLLNMTFFCVHKILQKR